MTKVPADVIILPEFSGKHPDRWVALNVFSRTCLGVSSKVLDFMSRMESLSESESQGLCEDEKFPVWEIERFSHADGLLADPTRYVRNVSQWKDVIELDVHSLVAKLKKHFIIIDDEVSYRNRFQLKKSLLDRDHFGNFHQQVGQHLLLVEREPPSKFWLSQKFDADLLSVRSDNLYGAVQANYLDQYFTRKVSSSHTVLDVGCGTGFYANMMARKGAQVLGIDPSREYIEIARQNAVPNARFEIMDVGVKGALDSIPDNFADIIYMSDALLFYFVPVVQGEKSDIQTLFADLRRILKREGTFISLEPHFVFWLMPWLGSQDHPFTVITEYMKKQFGVTTTISRLIQAFAEGGFAVTYMDELTPAQEFSTVDPRAYHFAAEFPIWHLFELKKAGCL